MRPDSAFAFENMSPENQGLYLLFFHKTDTAFTLQNMPFENQKVYVPLCYKNEHCLNFLEYTL